MKTAVLERQGQLAQDNDVAPVQRVVVDVQVSEARELAKLRGRGQRGEPVPTHVDARQARPPKEDGRQDGELILRQVHRLERGEL